MTTTEFIRPKAFASSPPIGRGAPAESQPSAMGAGAEIFRRLDRSERKPKWMAAVPVVVLAAFAVGGGLAYEAMSRPGPAPKPAPIPVAAALAPATPVAATPVAAQPTALVTPAPIAAQAQAAPSPVVHGRYETARREAARHEASVARAARQAPVGDDVNTAATVPAPPATPAPVIIAPPPPTAAAPTVAAPTPSQTGTPSAQPTTPPQ